MSAAKVTVRDIREGPAPDLAGAPGHPAGDVDGQHGHAAGVGWVVLAVEAGAVGGIDHEVARRDDGGRVEGVDHRHPDASAAQAHGRRSTVGPVVALAGQDRHSAAVAPAEELQRGVGHRGTGAIDEDGDGLRRRRVTAAISSGVRTGITVSPAPRRSPRRLGACGSW